MGANSANLVQQRVTKLDPVQWPGVRPGPVSPLSAVSPISTASALPALSTASPVPAASEPGPEVLSSVVGSARDSLSEAVPTSLAETEEDTLSETVPVNPLGCFEPAMADEAEGEPEIEEVSALDLTKKLHQKYGTQSGCSVFTHD